MPGFLLFSRGQTLTLGLRLAFSRRRRKNSATTNKHTLALPLSSTTGIGRFWDERIVWPLKGSTGEGAGLEKLLGMFCSTTSASPAGIYRTEKKTKRFSHVSIKKTVAHQFHSAVDPAGCRQPSPLPGREGCRNFLSCCRLDQ